MIKKILLGLFILNSFNGICQKFNFSEATTAPLTKDPSKVTLKVLHLIQQNNLDSLMFLEETKEIYKNSNKNMKKFFDNSEKVCKIYIENRNLNEEDVRKLFERGGK